MWARFARCVRMPIPNELSRVRNLQCSNFFFVSIAHCPVPQNHNVYSFVFVYSSLYIPTILIHFIETVCGMILYCTRCQHSNVTSHLHVKSEFIVRIRDSM